MERRFIVTAPGLAEPLSPISQAVVVGNQCWVSGQLSVSEEGVFVPGAPTKSSAVCACAAFALRIVPDKQGK